MKILKKTLRTNSNFRRFVCESGKGQKNGLCRIEIEEGDKVAAVWNKNEIEIHIFKQSNERFCKAKSTVAHDYETCSVIKNDETRDIILNGESHRDTFNDDDNVCQFLAVLKRP